MNDATAYNAIDASGRMWPAEGAELARMWNRCKPLRAYCDAYRMANFIANVRHTLSQNVNDYAPRGPSRNRAGAGNRRWRKYEAARGRVIFSAPFFDIAE